MKKYYPAFVDIEEQPCLVVGGGAIAEEKAGSLLECGGVVTVISPDLTDELRDQAERGALRWFAKTYEPGDVRGYRLVISATDSTEVNERVYRDAEAEGIMVNVVDVPALCRYIVPSIVRQGDLCIAISTGGKSPALAKKIRGQLEGAYGPEYAELLDLLGAYRPRMKAAYPDETETRARLWTSLVDSDLLDLLRAGRAEEARDRVESCILHSSD
ncbi:MAG: bifunctional precorrin-2 dehydrogenase/sirohydrochlorin ferrochelatase [Gemmatimonadetes bacterium]|nr:bifunctional precorrin-2 dehydrogenase/sirohydrochlorin ferrochelatase [Gemmatimonadota bacterium]